MTSRPPRRHLHPAFWVLLGLLLAIGIPWYRTPGTLDPLFWGLPLWALVALGSALAIALVAQWGIARLWHDDPEDGDG